MSMYEHIEYPLFPLTEPEKLVLEKAKKILSELYCGYLCTAVMLAGVELEINISGLEKKINDSIEPHVTLKTYLLEKYPEYPLSNPSNFMTNWTQMRRDWVDALLNQEKEYVEH